MTVWQQVQRSKKPITSPNRRKKHRSFARREREREGGGEGEKEMKKYSIRSGGTRYLKIIRKYALNEVDI